MDQRRPSNRGNFFTESRMLLKYFLPYNSTCQDFWYRNGTGARKCPHIYELIVFFVAMVTKIKDDFSAKCSNYTHAEKILYTYGDLFIFYSILKQVIKFWFIA